MGLGLGLGLGLELGLGSGLTCASGSGAARRKNFSAAAGSSAKRCPGTPQSMHEAQCSVSYEHLSAQLALSVSHACSQRAVRG